MRIFFIPNRLGLLLLTLIVLLFVVTPMAVLAQDATPEPPIVVDEPPTTPAPVFEAPAFSDALQALVAGLVAVFATAIASPLTAPLVSLVKRIPIPFFQNMPGEVVNLLIAISLSGVLWIGQALGFAGQVDTFYRLVYVLLPFLGGVGGNFAANALVYMVGKKVNMPVLGYARTSFN